MMGIDNNYLLFINFQQGT